MFYVVVDEVGFCYIPTATVTDQRGIEAYNVEVIAPATITKDVVNQMLNNRQAIATESLEEAVNVAEKIYKKLPRYRRQIDFDITTPTAPTVERYGMTVIGMGTLIEEISEKYL